MDEQTDYTDGHDATIRGLCGLRNPKNMSANTDMNKFSKPDYMDISCV